MKQERLYPKCLRTQRYNIIQSCILCETKIQIEFVARNLIIIKFTDQKAKISFPELNDAYLVILFLRHASFFIYKFNEYRDKKRDRLKLFFSYQISTYF